MTLPNDFLWGGAVAANQAEGGMLAGGRGLTNTDVVPMGSDRMAIAKGDLDNLERRADYFYPSQDAIEMYDHYLEDIDLLAGMGLKCFRLSLIHI